jgi:hypothetical protein
MSDRGYRRDSGTNIDQRGGAGRWARSVSDEQSAAIRQRERALASNNASAQRAALKSKFKGDIGIPPHPLFVDQGKVSRRL